jgi:exoribonuclease-2
MNPPEPEHRIILQNIAHRAMLARGLAPDFSAAAQAELADLHAPTFTAAPPRDLRQRLWCSIDNDDSLDLDQLTLAEALPQGQIKLLIAVADVDALVKAGCAIDAHARLNTTSVYTAAEIFPMLPERLSTGLTSLNLNQDRPAIVTELVLAADGALLSSAVYQAWVHNQAKLAYNSLAPWLEGAAPVPQPVAAVPGLAENLRLQDQAAQRLKTLRHLHGSLSLETIETRPVFTDGKLTGLALETKNRAKELIADLMIAANGVAARYLTQQK